MSVLSFIAAVATSVAIALLVFQVARSIANHWNPTRGIGVEARELHLAYAEYTRALVNARSAFTDVMDHCLERSLSMSLPEHKTSAMADVRAFVEVLNSDDWKVKISRDEIFSLSDTELGNEVRKGAGALRRAAELLTSRPSISNSFPELVRTCREEVQAHDVARSRVASLLPKGTVYSLPI